MAILALNDVSEQKIQSTIILRLTFKSLVKQKC